MSYVSEAEYLRSRIAELEADNEKLNAVLDPTWATKAGLLREENARLHRIEEAAKELLWYVNQLELIVYSEDEGGIEHPVVARLRSALDEEEP